MISISGQPNVQPVNSVVVKDAVSADGDHVLGKQIVSLWYPIACRNIPP